MIIFTLMENPIFKDYFHKVTFRGNFLAKRDASVTGVRSGVLGRHGKIAGESVWAELLLSRPCKHSLQVPVSSAMSSCQERRRWQFGFTLSLQLWVILLDSCHFLADFMQISAEFANKGNGKQWFKLLWDCLIKLQPATRFLLIARSLSLGSTMMSPSKTLLALLLGKKTAPCANN